MALYAVRILGGERVRPHWWSREGGVETMAMPQRDDTIEAIKPTRRFDGR